MLQYIIMKKRIAVAALSFGLVAGCSSGQERLVEEPSVQGNFEAAGSEWPIICYGRQDIVAKAGDTLLRLILNNTAVHDSSALGEPNISREALADAVADDLNNNINPDRIFAGKTYSVPMYCEPDVYRT
jgi:hypothetical protein